MAKLSQVLKDFLLRNKSRFKYRKFLIHSLTRSLKDGMEFKSNIIGDARAHAQPTYIELTNSLDSPVYPDLKTTIQGDQVKKLNILDQWMYEHNIPMITENKNLFQLVKQYQNFSSCSDEEQGLADVYSKQVRDCTNAEYFDTVIQQYFKNEELFEIINVTDNTGKTSVAELFASIDDLIKHKSVYLTILSDNINERLMSEIDTLDVGPNDIENVKEKITTTVGRIIANHLIYVMPFGNMFAFENKPIKLDDGDMRNNVNKALLNKKITVESYKKYLDSLYFLGHFTELCTPGVTEHSLMTSDEVKKRKNELYEQYKDSLNDPETISKIENELIAMDKAYMKGDNSNRLYIPLGGSSYNLYRKKMYIAVGGIEAFSNDSSKYEFLRNSLEEGLRVQDISIYGNESRKGSYNRGHETAKSGALTKDVIRAFHDSRITMDDCGSKEGILVDFNKIPVEKFMGRYILLQGKWVEITNDICKSIQKNKSYLVRSPLYCKCTNGFCYKCVGKLFADLDVRQVALTIVDITTTFMLASMKNMHGTKLELIELKPNTLDQFVL